MRSATVNVRRWPARSGGPARSAPHRRARAGRPSPAAGRRSRGGGHGRLQVGHRLVVLRARLPGAAAGDQRPAANLQIADPLGGLEAAGEQVSGIVGGRPAQRLLTGEQPGARGPRPVLDRSRVQRHRLRAVGQQVGGPPVVGQPRRRRRRRVEHLADQVVRELVVAAGDDEQPGRQRVLAAGHHGGQRLVQQVGDDVRLERHAEHGRGAQQLLDRPSRPAGPGRAPRLRARSARRSRRTPARAASRRRTARARVSARRIRSAKSACPAADGEPRHRRERAAARARSARRCRRSWSSTCAPSSARTVATTSSRLLRACRTRKCSSSTVSRPACAGRRGSAAPGRARPAPAGTPVTASNARRRSSRRCPAATGAIDAEHGGDLGHQAGEVPGARSPARSRSTAGGRPRTIAARSPRRSAAGTATARSRSTGARAPRRRWSRRSAPARRPAGSCRCRPRRPPRPVAGRRRRRRSRPGAAAASSSARPTSPSDSAAPSSGAARHRRGGIVVAQQREVDRLRFGRRVGAEFSGKTLAQVWRTP